MATCNFCGREFRNAQAVRAHLRHCDDYRAHEPEAGPPQRALPSGSLPRGRNLPKAGQPQAGFTPMRQMRPSRRLPRRLSRAEEPDLDAMEAAESWEKTPELGPSRAELEAEERKRREEAAQALVQQRRQIIQRVKDRVIGHFWAIGYTIPPETKARALRDIEHELSALALEELPESELVVIADGIRDKYYRPVMQAQDEAKRLEAQQRQEAMERALRQQEEENREAEKRAQKEKERRQEEAERAADRRELVRYGKGFARDELQDVEDLDPLDRLRILQRVDRELDAELTGDESEEDVEDLVDEILAAEGIE